MGPPHLTDELVARVRAWRDEDPDPGTRAELDRLLGVGDATALAERFAARLQFGTAGLRGPLGAGPSRMNRVVVRRATAGLAAWLTERGRHGGVVVVGRDARHRSDDFATDTAAVLAAAGYRAQVLPEPVPTPVLAFAVRHLGAVAGVMITASHNPPGDNGYKLYLDDGAQIVPPADAEVSAAIDAVGRVADIPLALDRPERATGVTDAYVAAVAGLLEPDGPRDLQVAHTALHGVGAATVRTAFERAGFPAPHEVAAQADPDPDFPTVAFPNPEEAGALDLVLAHATATGAELVLANDPDADRLAVAVPDRTAPGGWQGLTGDEIGVLLADHLLRTRSRTDHDVVATTVVSSRLLFRVAEAAGARCAECLTGFKWIARAAAPGERRMFGYEEALGYGVGDVVREKDGVSAALVMAELAAVLRAEGRTVLDRLDELARRHGLHATRSRSIRVGGGDWLDRVEAAMARVRAQPPEVLAGRAVVEVDDLASGRRLPPANVLVWTLDGGRVVLRPSGTEPKLKCYAEVVEPVEADADVPAARARASTTLDALLGATVDLLGGAAVGEPDRA